MLRLTKVRLSMLKPAGLNALLLSWANIGSSCQREPMVGGGRIPILEVRSDGGGQKTLSPWSH